MTHLAKNPMLSRYSVATTTAVVITGALFWIMQSAIQNDDITIVDPPIGDLLPFVRLEIDEALELRRREIPKPPPPVDKLPPTPEALTKETGGGYHTERYTPPVVPGDKYTPATHADGDALPIVTVAPEYPRRQIANGVEGWVIVEFVIDKLGRVQNATVVDAQPGSVFNNAALKAVQRYKYKPKVVNGQAMPVHGVRHRIVFDLS